MLLHPDRYSSIGVPNRKTGVVVHDSESGDASHQTLVRLLQAPGDRPLAGGGIYGSGYHAVTDGISGYTIMADSSAGPYSAPPVNKTWWHVCIPGRASQTRAEWLDELSYAHIVGVAKFIVLKQKIDGFPLVKQAPVGMRAGQGGYASHYDVSLAWGKTNHTDPGSQFPWDILDLEIKKLTQPPTTPTPPEEEEMAFLVRPDNDAAVFIVSGNEMTWAVSQAIIDARRADGSLQSGDPKVINPVTLKTYALVGPEPDYSGGDGGLPGRTKAANFAAWIK